MGQVQDTPCYLLDAYEVVEFKLMRSKKDWYNEELSFSPTYVHQIFDDETESIYGYEGLEVQIHYTAELLHSYVRLKYEKRVEELNRGLVADDVKAIIQKEMPKGFSFINEYEFLNTFDRTDEFQPFGEKHFEYQYSDEDGKERVFEFYKCSNTEGAFLKYFLRLQSFILWFVDGASYINVYDKKWAYFICYEKYKNDNGADAYATVGYTTVYESKSCTKSQNIRPRISQMLVLPPFQKLGVGTNFLETVYRFYQIQKNVVDITVKNPTNEFKRLRNYVECKLCMNLKSFQEEELKNGFNEEMYNEAREALKLNPQQCRKVYEVLRLFYTNIHDEEEYLPYRHDVIKRLFTKEFQSRFPKREQRVEELQNEFKELMKVYNKIIKKLKRFI